MKIDSLSFWLQLTDYCNLTCDYCYIKTLNKTKVMSNEIILQFSKKLLATVKKYPNINTITLKLAGGEPLSQFNSWKNEIQYLIKEMKENKIDLNIRILTNLTILDEEIIKYCKKNNITLAVSLDGLEKYHNKYRKYKNNIGSFSIVEKNLKLLRHNKLNFVVLVTISDDNLDGVIELVKFLLDEDITFRLADAKGMDIDRKKLSEILNECYILMEKHDTFDIKYKHVLCDLNLLNEATTPCNMGVSSGALYIDGNIFFCHSQFGSNLSIGNIYDSDDLLTTIQKGYGFHSLSDECKSCEFSKICAGGCPLYRTNNNKTPMCKIFKEVIPKIKKLQRNI
ncbi:radical SAM/SPASM domain-containing protein [Malaciobacter marinus]|jgi:uncharacterized protein|uniref:radical SAM/SPASM domain-containing protein n=1 Tax=Malaciobacter marinus TaxID=505249 RepID=UPI0009A87EDB|nr:radical SAM protein [Malaciobacter marinus]SKB31034.1 uncharacterized protein SAMN06295997_104140 [Malaciobacter marinus]